MVYAMDSETKNYEIGYLLPSSLSGEEVLDHVRKISDCLQECMGMVKHTAEPKKVKLAYPIKKERNAYFGWATFSASSDALKTIEKKMKEQSRLLRFLITEKEKSEMRWKPLRTPAVRKESTQPTKQDAAFSMPKEERLDLEALDKKLEEILGK